MMRFMTCAGGPGFLANMLGNTSREMYNILGRFSMVITLFTKKMW